jgi:hypothetical protein
MLVALAGANKPAQLILPIIRLAALRQINSALQQFQEKAQFAPAFYEGGFLGYSLIFSRICR